MTLEQFWGDVKGAEHSFVKWASTLWADVKKDEPEIASIVDDGLNYVGPALDIVVTETAGTAAGATVANIISSVQSKLKAFSGLVSDFGADTTSAQVLQTAQNDLSNVAAVGNLGSKAQTVLSKVISEIGVMYAAVVKAVTAASATASPAAAGTAVGAATGN